MAKNWCLPNLCYSEPARPIASGPEQLESMGGDLCSGTSTWSLSALKAEKHTKKVGRFRPQQNSLSTPAGTTYRPQQIRPRQVLHTDPSRNSRPQRHKCFLHCFMMDPSRLWFEQNWVPAYHFSFSKHDIRICQFKLSLLTKSLSFFRPWVFRFQRKNKPAVGANQHVYFYHWVVCSFSIKVRGIT